MPRIGAADIIAGLVQRGVPRHIAEGVVMNFQDESGLDTGIQEQAPTSGRGGFGLAQWTGPRRVALEDFAKSQGKRIDDPNVQLDFFMQENVGPEAAAWKKIMYAPDAKTAAVEFVNRWERPAPQYAAQRSARYQGMSDSPSEGGARFGGTGLGDPAAAPVAADGTPVPTARPDKAPPPVAAAGNKDKYGKAIGGALGSMAGAGAPVLGEGGNAPQMQAYQSAPANSMAIVSEGGGGVDRQTLALLMHNLNNRTLWG